MVRLLLLSVFMASISCGGGIESTGIGDDDAGGTAVAPIDPNGNASAFDGTSDDASIQPTHSQCLGPEDGCGNRWCFPLCDDPRTPNPNTSAEQNSTTAPRLPQ